MDNVIFSKDAAIAASQKSKERDYWLKQLSGDLVKSSFPLLGKKSQPGVCIIGKEEFGISTDLFQKLMELSNDSYFRIHIILVAGLILLMEKYTGNNDIIVGIPIYKQDIDGELVNTVLALRTRIDKNRIFKEFLFEVAKTVFDANENQNYPMETLLYKLNLPFPAGDFPLFDTALLLENIHEADYLRQVKPNTVFKFKKAGEYIIGQLDYNAALYDKSYVQGIVNHYINLLRQFVFNLNLKLSGLDILSLAEKKKLIYEFNNNNTHYSRDKTVCQLIEAQAERTPARIAVIFEKKYLTYRRLNESVNRLAWVLRSSGLGEDCTVGILMERTPLLLESILAVWKAGGAYIPMETDYPKQRILEILNDSGTGVLIGCKEHIDEALVKAYSGKILLPAEHIRQQAGGATIDGSGEHVENRGWYINMSSLAYVIYTSGSTGKPKGAMVEHIGMMNHLQAKMAILQLTGESTVAQNASHTFDISVWQFFAALNTGGRTIIYSHELILEPEQFIARLIENEVTILEVVPSYLAVMLDSPAITGSVTAPLFLHYLLVTGEETTPHLVKKWFDRFPRIPLVNAYGPTEASDDITHFVMDKPLELDRVPIGKPLQNLNIYIVDNDMCLCPVGVIGEILVSGIGVGRGYLKDMERTARVFMEDPFLEEKGVRLYKTGDLGRWLPDGIIEFFGRKDNQVKIRGYRIEPGEIERRLSDFEGIKEAVIMDKVDDTGNKYLCAYIVARGKLKIPAVKAYLSECLPDYLVPSYFVELEKIPLTPNGKIDRKALPEPSFDSMTVIPYLDIEMLQQIVIPEEKESRDLSFAGNCNNEDGGELSPQEREKVLYTFNDTKVDYQSRKTIAEFFKEQVEMTPNWMALVFEDQQVTFKEFDRSTSRVAAILKKNGVRSGSIVGLMVERSMEILVGMFSILKAGGAYLPIGYEYPEERKKYILKDSSVKILLTDGKEDRPGYPARLIDIGKQQLYEARPGSEILDDPRPGMAQRSSTDPAYVIYTSGTTGVPKGVLLENRALMNLIKGMTDIVEFSGSDIFFSLITISFDIFILESILPLTGGSRVVIGSEEQQLDHAAAAAAMAKYCITICQGTPSMMQLFAVNANAVQGMKTLRYLLISGEVFSKILLEKLKKITPAKIFNGYGPSETTVWSTAKDVTDGIMNIGKPLANTRVYILGHANRVQPIGVVGELFIGGCGVGRGYIGRPELTAAKFIPDPFIKGGRIYRTGDMARWLPDGNIEFLGRNDHQLKLSGIRVELEDIESQLMAHDDISSAVVIAKENENVEKYLCAYVVSDKRLTFSDLAGYLLLKLPAYMVPSKFFQLEKIPLMPSGKVNRRLLEFVETKTGKSQGFMVPLDEVEDKLAEVWAEVLNIPKDSISTNTNFFDLGGHSLKAINLTIKAHKVLNIKLPLAEVFKTPTIKGLAEYIKKSSTHKYLSIKNVEKKEYYSLSPSQQRMYVVQEMNIDSKSYNMPIIVELEGELSIDRLNIAFWKLIERHDSLRTSFFMMEEGPVQRIHEFADIDFNMEYYETLGNKSLEQEIIKYFLKPFELSKAPLLRVALIRTGELKNVLMADMYHIISDGLSSGVLFNNFAALYNDVELSPLRIQYKDFAEWQNRLFDSVDIKNQENYWLDRFRGDIPVLNIPTDYSRPAVRNIDDGEIIEFQLEEDLCKKLYSLTKETKTTIFILLLAVYNVLLFKYTGQEDIIVGSPITGRSHADLENVIGVFLNMLAMRNHPQESKVFAVFLQEVKEKALAAFENQDYPFDQLVRKLELQGETGRNPLFDTEFAINNIDVVEVKIPGLKIKPYPGGIKFAKFDLHFLVLEGNDTIKFVLHYCTTLFKRVTVEKIQQHYIEILEQVGENPQIKLEDIFISLDLLAAPSNILDEVRGDFEL